MRIAQVAPLTESVPPKTYGGIERVVHYLTEELVSRGHDVTLFASGDSQTSADLVAVVPDSSRNSEQDHDSAIRQIRQLMEVVRMADKFDVVHFHTDYQHFPVWRFQSTMALTTMHGRIDMPDLDLIFEEFAEMPLISISNSQRLPHPNASWKATVYNGTPGDFYTLRDQPGDYFAFLGRFCPEKGPAEAIEIAKRCGVPLKMAAKIDHADRAFFDHVVKPHLDDPLIEFIGEVDECGKDELLGGAKALLFPIAWPEPFGLVMTEAMACGTPVIARRYGSVDEVMKNGVSGFVIDTIDQAVEAVQKLDQIGRRACRQYFDDHFSVQRMTDGYLDVYENLAAAGEISVFKPAPPLLFSNPTGLTEKESL